MNACTGQNGTVARQKDNESDEVSWREQNNVAYCWPFLFSALSVTQNWSVCYRNFVLQ